MYIFTDSPIVLLTRYAVLTRRMCVVLQLHPTGSEVLLYSKICSTCHFAVYVFPLLLSAETSSVQKEWTIHIALACLVLDHSPGMLL